MAIIKSVHSMATVLTSVIIYCLFHSSWSYLSININPNVNRGYFLRPYHLETKIQDSLHTLRATIQSRGVSGMITGRNNPILKKIQDDIEVTKNAHDPIIKKIQEDIKITKNVHDELVNAFTQGATLPWSDSIVAGKDLTYMNMFQSQQQIMKDLGMTAVTLPNKFVYKTSNIKPARIGNMCFQNEIFRKVRMTYFDAGDNVQVFNSVWYPHYQYDLPMLGIDLISLGRSRVLTVIDMQPLHPTAEYSAKYIDHLTPVRAQYPDLQGVMSGKIYDDTSFFSKNMLFGRFTNESKVQSTVFPAFEEYLNQYLSMAKNAKANRLESSMNEVRERQKAYDIYSALKDPAVGLFDAYFGKEWSREFVHEYLFSLSATDHVTTTSAGGSCVSKEEGPVHTFKINQETGEVSVKSNSK